MVEFKIFNGLGEIDCNVSTLDRMVWGNFLGRNLLDFGGSKPSAIRQCPIAQVNNLRGASLSFAVLYILDVLVLISSTVFHLAPSRISMQCISQGISSPIPRVGRIRNRVWAALRPGET